jgi:hypothetical protein
MRKRIECSLVAATVPEPLIQALLDTYLEVKENFYFGRFRPSELEGGRFAEAAIRVAQHLATGSHVPLDRRLPQFDQVVLALSQVPVAKSHESLRLHIPRALWSVYAVRNRRDVGHIGGDVNPNRADAHFVMSVCDWVLAELVRLTFNYSLLEAQTVVDDLVERKIPLVQDFNGFPKILRTDLSIPDKIMILAYVGGKEGVGIRELQAWLKPAKPSAIMVATLRLERDRAFLHRTAERCLITISGLNYVEENIGFALARKPK